MVIIGIVFAISIILLIYSIYHDKINFLMIKLDNVEEKINSTLIKRKELLKDSEKNIKEVANTNKEIYDGLKDINDSNIDMMELDRKLLVYINEFYLIKDKYQKLQKSEEFQKIAFAITETEDLLNAYKDYYNDNAEKYNKLIKRFPVIIITLIKRRKEKLFFDKKSINDNDYNDFKY
jgi:hypothetical protein